MARDDYTRLAETLDEEFSNASIRIDNSGQTKTLIVDVYGIDTSIEEVDEWISSRNNMRDAFGFGEKDLSVRTEPEGNDKLLVSIEHK